MNEKTCKVFTPPDVVNYMLDKINYINNLYGKRILENSCGTGRFLGEIVGRYIIDARKNGRSDKEIKNGLETDIQGIEKEKDIYLICKSYLDSIAYEFGLKDINWNIRLGDALKIKYTSDYQFVVGNPPYITYYNMSVEDRELIRQKYTVCEKGKADYYYAFTEAALRVLAPDGIMAYLIPNNFMKNRYSEELRKYILPYLYELEDFKFEKIFDNRQISSAIILCSKQSKKDEFVYIDRESKSRRNIFKKELHGKWMFDIVSEGMEEKKRFGDCFKVSAPVATLLNEAFVIKDYKEKDTWIEKDGFKLEKKGLRKAASPKSMQYKENNYIIFPYFYEARRCCKYEEERFLDLFPEIAAYLGQYSDKLLKRKSDKNSKWYEYGRSQALEHINQEKIMLSTLITGGVKYYTLEKATVPYSGMYIVPKENYTIKQAEQILASQDFYEYIKSVGIHANGKTYRISPRDVEDFIFKEQW